MSKRAIMFVTMFVLQLAWAVGMVGAAAAQLSS